MAVINIQTAPPAGLAAVTSQVSMTQSTLPSVIYIQTTDTYATVTTTGYLTHFKQEGFTFSSNQMALVYTTDDGPVWLQVAITYANSSVLSAVISLIEINAPGDVVLPTIANHIATFTNTTGTISEDPATAISGGNIQAGLSGTAGYLASFPGTASKGSLEVKAVANTGNTITTISNAAMGQASVVSIPDPGAATANFAVAPAALVSGNLIEASGTAGLVADAGISVTSVSGVITQVGQLYQTSVTLNTAAVIAAYATPQVLIPAVAGKVAVIIAANVYTNSTGNTAFTTGVAPIIQYGATVHGAGTIAVGAGLVTGDIEAASSQVRTLGPAASTTYTAITNTPVTFSCTTAYAAGTGSSVTFSLVYQLITATV